MKIIVIYAKRLRLDEIRSTNKNIVREILLKVYGDWYQSCK